jgi:hypothetical protein
MTDNESACHFLSSVVIDVSYPYNPRLKKIFNHLKERISLHTMALQKRMIVDSNKGSVSNNSFDEILNLEPGELVQVRSIEEINASLDEKRKYKGLVFMKGQEKFCGKKYKVFKKVKEIRLESTGEHRILISPTVFLEGVICDGISYEGCDRACYIFWREAWLKRVAP